MKDSIDYNDIIDIMIKKVERNLADNTTNDEQLTWYYGRLSVLKELLEISEYDIHEYHSKLAHQLIKVRSIVAKM